MEQLFHLLAISFGMSIFCLALYTLLDEGMIFHWIQEPASKELRRFYTVSETLLRLPQDIELLKRGKKMNTHLFPSESCSTSFNKKAWKEFQWAINNDPAWARKYHTEISLHNNQLYESCVKIYEEDNCVSHDSIEKSYMNILEAEFERFYDNYIETYQSEETERLTKEKAKLKKRAIILKPIVLCVICFASIWGTVAFWTYQLLFDVFPTDLKLIAYNIIACMMCSFFNVLLYGLYKRA